MTHTTKFIIGLISILTISCSNKKQVLYIKLINQPELAKKSNLDVRFRGVTVGEITSSEIRGQFLILKAEIRKQPTNAKYLASFYRRDILGNTFLELTDTTLSTNLIDKRFLSGDSIYGVYAPLFHEVDSIKKKQIIQTIRDFKQRLDSITNIP